MRKVFVIIILLATAFLCALWSPWNNWNFSLTQLLGIVPPAQIGGLQVTSLAGELEIFVDGESLGTVDPDSSPLSLPGIEPGERQVRLHRTSEVEGAYWEFNRLIKFESGVDVVIAYELGPTEKFSEGHVIYATKSLGDSNKVSLNIKSSSGVSKVSIDNLPAGETPIVGYDLSLLQQHKVNVFQDGYDPQEFTILPDSQELRDKLKGFDLNVEVDLFLQPISVR